MNQRLRKAAARKPPKAERRRVRLLDRLSTWRDLHLYSLVSSFGRIAQRPWASGLTVGVMAVALALPLCLALLMGNLQRFGGAVETSQRIAVFVAMATPNERLAGLMEEVRQLPGVSEVELRTPEQGLEEFRELTDFADALALLDENPLPPVLDIAPRVDADVEPLLQTLTALPEADSVHYDAAWRTRLDQWLELGQRLAWVVAALLGLGALLVVGNTVRLDIQGRAEEIAVLQLLGATDGFVRRPFLYLGVWYGALAGALALLLAWLSLAALRAPVASLVASYGSRFELAGFAMLDALVVIGGAMALGWLGAWLAAGHHLRHTLPKGGTR